MSLLTVGVFATSQKEQELRVPIHPEQLSWIDEDVRRLLLFETDYGVPFGVSNETIQSLSGGLAPRADLFDRCDIALLAKPVQADFAQMKEGTIHWGWPHCVQQREITQLAIDRRLTLLAFEAMFHWSRDGARGVHIFYKNNELAGYCAILDALRLVGWDGAYGPPRRAVILSFGSVSRGAAHALIGRGFTDVTALTLRPPHLVRDQRFGVRYGQMHRGEAGTGMTATPPLARRRPLAEVLAETDLVVNGTLQDPERPLMFVREGEEDRLRERSLIVDVSCDAGMGFPFARPTSFEDPMFQVGRNVRYYAVDHTPTYLWGAASWEISGALLPYLRHVRQGPDAWTDSQTLKRAVEIRDGVVQNPVILSFQGRAEAYPHPVESE